MKAIVEYYTGTVTDVRLYMTIILLPLILLNWVSYLFSYFFLAMTVFIFLLSL